MNEYITEALTARTLSERYRRYSEDIARSGGARTGCKRAIAALWMGGVYQRLRKRHCRIALEIRDTWEF